MPPITINQILYLLEKESTESFKMTHKDLSEISDDVVRAAIVSEDSKFFKHRGFDFKRMKMAFKSKHIKKHGASTISQQVAKNVFLWNGGGWIRKVLEYILPF
jgi:monofunctional glycosyltransferase